MFDSRLIHVQKRFIHVILTISNFLLTDIPHGHNVKVRMSSCVNR